MKKRINYILRKCKTLSRQLGRTSSYSSLSRSKSSSMGCDDELENRQEMVQDDDQTNETIFVGSSRRRYVVSSKFLSHPLLSALIIRKSKTDPNGNSDPDLLVKCEVVLFDHLLWMLQNADPNIGSDSLEELAELYVN